MSINMSFCYCFAVRLDTLCVAVVVELVCSLCLCVGGWAFGVHDCVGARVCACVRVYVFVNVCPYKLYLIFRNRECTVLNITLTKRPVVCLHGWATVYFRMKVRPTAPRQRMETHAKGRDRCGQLVLDDGGVVCVSRERL